ncbi:MAG: AraC family transcriptional regulator [Deltaproteobacteria bacterium]|nr:AraC family transcriptional regulator [Deltaproteobacteria bacterium]
MGKYLSIENVNDFARYVGSPVLHPLVSVVHYDELERCRHCLCEYGVYGLFLMKESPYTIQYGQGVHKVRAGSLMCVAPGHKGGVTDNGEIIHIKGWVMLFHPSFLQGTTLERRIKDYHFFSYYSNEALLPTPDEWLRLERCIAAIRKELIEYPDDPHLKNIVLSYITLLLELAARFYERQFQVVEKDDFGRKVESVLDRYYAEGRQEKNGVPGVRYCAGELCLSPNYFGDLVRTRTGESATQFIRGYLMRKARRLLLDGQSVTAVSDALGFEYPQHFTRMFKKEFGIAPSRLDKV